MHWHGVGERVASFHAFCAIGRPNRRNFFAGARSSCVCPAALSTSRSGVSCAHIRPWIGHPSPAFVALVDGWMFPPQTPRPGHWGGTPVHAASCSQVCQDQQVRIASGSGETHKCLHGCVHTATRPRPPSPVSPTLTVPPSPFIHTQQDRLEPLSPGACAHDDTAHPLGYFSRWLAIVAPKAIFKAPTPPSPTLPTGSSACHADTPPP